MKKARMLKLFGLVICLMFSLQITGCDVSQLADSSSISKEDSTGSVSGDGTLSVQFLDVGQGNAVLLENAGKYMLIDGGDREYSSFVVSYLKKQGVKTLDTMISSHYDADHLNGLVGALNVFDVSKVLDADYKADTRVYKSFVKGVKSQSAEEKHPEAGDEFRFGDAKVSVVCPFDFDSSNDNDNSIGVRITYGKVNFLICGDASTSVEQQMLDSGEDLDATVYMCSHHGSKTASSEEFLDAVDPKYAVISAGVKNKYGHPDAEVMERLQERKIPVFRTDEQGTIIAETDGKKISWNVKEVKDYRSGDEMDGKTAGKKAVVNKIQTEEEQDSQTVENTTGNQKKQTYILNTSTKKFHLPDCGCVKSISDVNKKEVKTTRKELEEEGYQACKVCIGE